MCGITGYIHKTAQPLGSTDQIQQMLLAQKHRGPDDSGICAFNIKTGKYKELPVYTTQIIPGDFNGIIGFNRLSILDLSENGHQPMSSPDGNVILTMNGEIYNAFDFREELINWGYKFKSSTDTEIVLALYLKYGFESMIRKLNGMFAMVIVDLKLSKILVVRDRFGIKPMYYISDNKLFAFSSEIKSFKLLGHFVFETNQSQIDEFLLFRNNIRGTLFKNIEELSPGNYIEYNGNGELRTVKYFDIDNYSRTQGRQSEDEAMSIFQNYFARSVKRQLMSDVKLGCQLSGGIDSSLVTWQANQYSEKGTFESVSIVFDDEHFSEKKYIQQVSDSLGITSHYFKMDESNFLKDLRQVAWSFETPVNHPNTVGIYRLSKEAKKYVTVLLSGEGADEVFAGYPRFYDVSYPFINKKFVSAFLNMGMDRQSLFHYFDPRLRAILPAAFANNLMVKRIFSDFKPDKAIQNRLMMYEQLSGDQFDRQVKYEIKSYLPDLLVRQDKMSMSHSIENRVPFLDNELVKASFSISKLNLLKFRTREKNTEKYLLKKYAATIFGNEFAFRDKMGFGIPLRSFFNSKEFNEYLKDEILPGIKRRGIFNAQVVENWINNFTKIKHLEIEMLWIVISYELWASLYIDK